jgi:hypothetical protein
MWQPQHSHGASSTCRQASGKSAMVNGGFGFGGISDGCG